MYVLSFDYQFLREIGGWVKPHKYFWTFPLDCIHILMYDVKHIFDNSKISSHIVYTLHRYYSLMVVVGSILIVV